MENLAIPAFDAKKKIHAQLAALSIKAHQRVKQRRPVDEMQGEINALAEKLWNIKS